MNDVFCSYYTKNKNITSYMVSKISPLNSDKILEPCGGDGMFIDALLNLHPSLSIDTCDLDMVAVQNMQSKYAVNNNISVRRADTLTDELFDEYSSSGFYDKIIGNPPYGGWQEYDKRSALKKKFSGFYVKETYSLFLLRCISLLKEGGVLSFIIPDTFLYLHNHKSLREYLLKTAIINEITVFPSKFFPGVSFGYSNLCIITLTKEKVGSSKNRNIFPVIKNLKSDDDLMTLSFGDKPKNATYIHLSQKAINLNLDCAFFIGDEKASQQIVASESRILNIADCVTGIYCGDNKKFLAIACGNHRRVAGYPIIDNSSICLEHQSITPLESAKKYIPIVKGSSSTSYYRTSDKWLIEWTETSVNHYNTDRKARFQNSKFYFRSGIALPMVKSSKIKATLMSRSVFDQSIVGVFPHEEKYMLYLLAYLNSDIANRYMHIINPTANNSANYIKKLPFYTPNKNELEMVDRWVSSIFKNEDNQKYQSYIDSFFEEKLNITVALSG